MDKPNQAAVDVVTLGDFEKLWRATPTALKKFSIVQVRSCFKQYAKVGDSIPVRQFKDLFYPSVPLGAAQQKTNETASSRFGGLDSQSMISDAASSAKSMHVDNMLMGKKAEDILKEQEQEERDKVLMELKAEKNKPTMRPIMETREDGFGENQSQSSMPSMAMDDIINRQAGFDPRQSKLNSMKPMKKQGGLASSSRLSAAAVSQLPQQQPIA